MSFKTLEQRYKEKVNTLYQGATTKFENGRPGGGTNADPLNTRRVGDESFGRISQLFGRFLPIARAFQDVVRLTKFTASLRGVTFLIKQGLLQTGNTFESTRLINPLFTIANAVPFLHVRRHLTPGALLSGLIGKTDTSTPNVRSMGQLQVSTYNKALGSQAGFRATITSAFTAKRNVGWENNTTPFNINDKWKTSRPELAAFDLIGKSIFSDRQQIDYSVEVGFPSRKFFENTVEPEFSSSLSLNALVSDETAPFIRLPRPKKYYYADESNDRINLADARNENKFPYDTINNGFDDYIAVKFQMGNQEPIKFRAYLSNLQQSVTPQYKDFQYIGRTEKFVTFNGAQRDVSFKLTVLAERPLELKEIWKRINYLTGLAFPYNVSNGIYQPNIMKMTIGKVFQDQPAYITSFNTNFSEVLESWDVDEQVPMSATIDMKCILIEKSQKVANSPFYKITEDYFLEEYGQRVAEGNRPRSESPDLNR